MTLITELRVDASPVGLGAILMQSDGHETRPVAYASRTLTDVERRYSQTEKEALAVVWGCEKFHLYLYRTEFKLFTDHKPLEFIYSPKGKPPPRIERWALRLQPYRFKVIHMPGKTNPADVLSRLPIRAQAPRERNIAEEYINFIAERAVPKAMTLEEIAKATEDDAVLQQVLHCLSLNHWPNDPALQKFSKVRDELSTSQGLLLRGTRIVMPKSLRPRTLSLAHENHQGIVRTKQLLRQKVCWPGIDTEAENLIKACLPCQSTMPQPVPEPLHPSTMPSRPWETVHIDLCGPFPTGESLLVCVDACSRWPEVAILYTATSKVIIHHLQKFFASHGLPEQVVSDNGSNLVSIEIESFFSSNGIRHRKVTPYWPQANATVERFNRTIEKAIRTAHIEGKDWRQELDPFLLSYRATPHAMTGVSPAKIMFGRDIRTKLPQLHPSEHSPVLDSAIARDQRNKQKMQQYSDKKNRAQPSAVKEGDMVLLKQPKTNKLSISFDPNPYRVVKRHGSRVLIQRGNDQAIMRNVSLTRKVEKSVDQQHANNSDEEDDIDEQPEPAVVVYRRPTRVRRPPARMQDFVRL